MNPIPYESHIRSEHPVGKAFLQDHEGYTTPNLESGCLTWPDHCEYLVDKRTLHNRDKRSATPKAGRVRNNECPADPPSNLSNFCLIPESP